MTRNVTLRMDEDLLTELRHQAVDAHMSLSAWITATLAERATNRNGIEEKRQRALRRLQQGFRLDGTPFSREDAHAR